MDNVISNLGFGYTVSAGKPTERFKHEDDHIPHEGAPMKSQQGGEAVITQRIGTQACLAKEDHAMSLFTMIARRNEDTASLTLKLGWWKITSGSASGIEVCLGEPCFA
jgi:hypothetical protein